MAGAGGLQVVKGPTHRRTCTPPPTHLSHSSWSGYTHPLTQSQQLIQPPATHAPLASQRRRSCSSVAPTVTAEASRAGLVSQAAMSSLPAVNQLN